MRVSAYDSPIHDDGAGHIHDPPLAGIQLAQGAGRFGRNRVFVGERKAALQSKRLSLLNAWSPAWPRVFHSWQFINAGRTTVSIEDHHPRARSQLLSNINIRLQDRQLLADPGFGLQNFVGGGDRRRLVEGQDWSHRAQHRQRESRRQKQARGGPQRREEAGQSGPEGLLPSQDGQDGGEDRLRAKQAQGEDCGQVNRQEEGDPGGTRTAPKQPQEAAPVRAL